MEFNIYIGEYRTYLQFYEIITSTKLATEMLLNVCSSMSTYMPLKLYGVPANHYICASRHQ